MSIAIRFIISTVLYIVVGAFYASWIDTLSYGWISHLAFLGLSAYLLLGWLFFFELTDRALWRLKIALKK